MVTNRRPATLLNFNYYAIFKDYDQKQAQKKRRASFCANLSVAASAIWQFL